jgi:DNA-binding response OmpR family regulator
LTGPPDNQVRILVVDDDVQIRQLLRSRFEREGFAVVEASDSRELDLQLGATPVSLITLDLRLGNDDGLMLAQRIRARNNIPLIIISAKDDEVDRVVGLELGADDYITKPFSPREVVARVRAVLRRYAGLAQSISQSASSTPLLSCELGSLDLARRELTAPSGQRIDLTTNEFNLLELFLRNPKRVLSRDEIMTSLKGHDWSPLDRSVDSAVARLRKKVEQDPDAPRFVKTVRGVGYVLVVDVKRS